MKKIFLFCVFILVSEFCFSQSDISFEKGVRVVEKKEKENFVTPKSILFIFEGDTHLINYYLELREKIKKEARKNKIKAGFNYELSSTNPFKEDLESIPKKKKEKLDYETTCTIYSSFSRTPERWGKYQNIKKRKTQHFLNFKIKNIKNEEIFTCKLDIHAYYTIVTESKKSSKLFFELITN
ncbi:hypothetical protein C7448_101442 [Tenacibaculum gallaicum]|uniref:Uncharacterized protein n=1 Tax=Tenacibaculum gallaicum TaxID=561505 RepID=A0A3E0ICV1_9FLAO|nr:hypothetical protein [Tenacibaculum gallaicum]REH56403.1 hypothetical protein C7448_101442 [Tenacibaculum gallaicum]